MNKIALLAGGSLLLLASPAIAQDAGSVLSPPESTLPEAVTETAPEPEPMPEPTLETGMTADAEATAEAPMPDPSAQTFTDEQVTGFVQAMTAIQALPGDDAAKQAQAVEIVAEAGIDAETYNAIGSAMQTDPALADRVRMALAAEQTAPGV